MNLGQTRALYIYDENQYEKERHEIMEAKELHWVIDGVTDRNFKLV